eukprot:GHVN01101092.1.p1 GENE.GHVN01101092.1~~GHVN01101092.1.p1  ORF type:complete len:222 (-),score=27.28 GHVN01101092.1:115-780(-)
MKSILAKIQRLEEVVEKQSDQLKSQRERIDNLEKRLITSYAEVAKKAQGEIAGFAGSAEMMAVNEVEARKGKRCNVNLVNVPSSASSVSEERKKDDVREVARIMGLAGINEGAQLVKSCFRVTNKEDGKGGNSRPPLLVVTLDSCEARDGLLRSASKLKGTNFYVRRDMTRAQRAQYKRLSQEALSKNGGTWEGTEEGKWVVRGEDSIMRLVRLPRRHGGS